MTNIKTVNEPEIVNLVSVTDQYHCTSILLHLLHIILTWYSFQMFWQATPCITLTSKYIAWSMPFLTCTLLSLSLSLVCAQFPWLLPPPHAHQGRVPGRLHRVSRCTFCCAGHEHPSGLLPALLRPWCHSYRVRQKQNGWGWLFPNLTTSVVWNI